MSARPDPRRWKALALLCLASFMVILDASIVTVALPSIERALDFSATGVQWVMTAYIVTFGGLLLFGGRLADLLGRRRVFLAGVGLFAAASLLCGLAWSGGSLVVARAVQGVAAAAMLPAGMSIVLTTFEEGAERNRAIGIWSAIAGVGATAGALFGGPLTDGLGWQWIFFINVPVGAVLVALGPRLLRESYRRAGVRRFDVAGAVTITAALMLLVYGVSQAPVAGVGSGRVLGSVAAAVLLIAVFAGIESRSVAPLMPLRVLRSRSFTGGNLVMLTVGMAAFAQGFVLTQYTQQVLGWSAVRYGLLTIVMPATAVVGSIVAQHLVTRIGARPVAAASMVLIGAGCALCTRLPVHASYAADLLPGLLGLGTGVGGGSVAASIAAVGGVEEHESGLASGVNGAAFQIGGALGIAVVGTVAVARTDHLAGRTGHLAALAGGYQTAFVAAIGFAVLGLLAAVTLLARRPTTADVDRTETVDGREVLVAASAMSS